MKHLLAKLFEHQALSRDEAKDVLVRMAGGEGNDAQVAAFMTVYLMRAVTPGELSGFREALLELCRTVDLPAQEAIDLCGTGGDGKHTFNISTLASFIVAGAGGKVIKHGNYGVSSVSGSSNVLEYFGHAFTGDRSKLARALEKSGVCFLHAPLFHPALKRVAPVRRDLGVKTFFNMLGPLVNPARPKHRVTGVFSLELARTYQYIAEASEEKYVILHNLDGYDELSLTGPAKLISNAGEQLVTPERLGFPELQPEEILGGATVAAAANVFLGVLENRGTSAQENVAVANAALALQCLGMHETLEEAVAASRESLHSGKALRAFETFISTR